MANPLAHYQACWTGIVSTSSGYACGVEGVNNPIVNNNWAQSNSLGLNIALAFNLDLAKVKLVDTTIIPSSESNIPTGSTVTPVNSIGTWLRCAGIFDKNYVTPTEVLADSTTLAALISSTNAVDYMVRSTSWATDVCADSTAMSLIGLNNYCANALIADSTWLNAIANSTYIESVMNVKVPTMTSNTTPSGVASSDPSAQTSLDPYKAFDGQTNTVFGVRPLQSSGVYTLSYQFSQQKCVYLARLNPRYQDFYGVNHLHMKTFKIQGYDGNTWVDLSDSITLLDQEYTSPIDTILTNASYYTSYRLYGTGSYVTYSDVYIIYIVELQFYGREDV
jgi:hypothetical protein